jgi:hypothetical protein
MGHVEGLGLGEVHIRFWWGNVRKKPLGRSRHRYEDNIKMDLKEICWQGVNSIDLARDMGQVVSSCEHGNEP